MPLGKIVPVGGARPRLALAPRRRPVVATREYVKRRIRQADEVRDLVVTQNSPTSLSWDVPHIASLVDTGSFAGSKNVDYTGAFHFKAMIQGATLVSSSVRVILFQWMSGTTPVALDILRPFNSANESITNVYNLDNRSNYQILMDRSYSVPAFATTSNVGDATKNVMLTIPRKRLQRKRVVSANSTGAAGYKGQLYLLAFSNTPDAGANPTILYQSIFNGHLDQN